MNANYPTAVSVPQTGLRLSQTGPSASPHARGLHPGMAGPAHRATAREMRKALRAAEMAAWEALPPPAQLQAAKPVQTISLREVVRTTQNEGLDRESLLILVLAAAALIGLMITVADTSALLAHWSQFVTAIRNLLG